MRRALLGAAIAMLVAAPALAEGTLTAHSFGADEASLRDGTGEVRAHLRHELRSVRAIARARDIGVLKAPCRDPTRLSINVESVRAFRPAAR